MLEAQDKKIKTSNVIRFVGGGALSEVTCQMLADITGQEVETVENPQNTGAVGAAVIAALGLGVIEHFERVKEMIDLYRTYYPHWPNKAQYDQSYAVFKRLYRSNKKHFQELNQDKR